AEQEARLHRERTGGAAGVQLVEVADRSTRRERAGVDDGVGRLRQAAAGVERADREVGLEEGVRAAQVGAALAGVGIVVAVGEAVGAAGLLAGQRLALAGAVDGPDAADAAEEAVLEVDETAAAQLAGRHLGPLRPIRSVGDVGAEQAERAREAVAGDAVGVDAQEDLVLQVLIAAVDPAGLVDDAAAGIGDAQVDPDLALLAEAGRYP